ncbi:unnamed protein product [Bursaphelenchus xylophilus]|nr:unnamed protein product [Bursaphelenchus xylophilus]CAG9115766.1 unnamed protein product [Bursaphelenchus xylophilus]
MKRYAGIIRRCLSTANKTPELPVFPEPPDPLSCCGSGCQNCIWIEYAEKVGQFFKEHPEGNKLTAAQKEEKIQRLLRENVTDTNLRAYLSIEVKTNMKN